MGNLTHKVRRGMGGFDLVEGGDASAARWRAEDQEQRLMERDANVLRVCRQQRDTEAQVVGAKV